MIYDIKTKLKNAIGKSMDAYNTKKLKPIVDELKFKEEYQGRIIDCMVGEVDDNYIETPNTDAPIVKLEYSREGIVKVPSIKGKTILVDADGNETDTPSEGCRLVSVGEDEDNKIILTSKNKNFMVSWTRGLVSPVDGSEVDSAKNIRTDFIPIRRENIYIRGLYDKIYSFVAFYDKDKNYIKRTSGASRSTIVLLANDNPNLGKTNEIPLDCKYIRLTQYTVLGHDATVEEIDSNTKQISIGYDNSDYVEPKSHKAEIILNEPLRSLPDGTCDEIVGNKLIKRLIQLNLEGTENIVSYKESDDYFRVIIADERLKGKWNVNKTYCNKLLYNHYDAYWVLSKCIALDSVGQLYICLPKNELSSYSIEGVREYLRNNDVQIIATLTEPIIEELPNGITLQGFDDTTMYVENSITPTVTYGYNALIPYKEELLNQQQEVETNILDIENNIMPYLMDMEFNLIQMGDD